MAPHRQRKYFTVMLIPHSERSVVTIKVPIVILQVAASLVAVTWIAGLLVLSSFLKVSALTDEVTDLRWVNREQREQIQYLIQETAQLRERFSYLADLERKVRELAQLEDETPISEHDLRLLSIDEALHDYRGGSPDPIPTSAVTVAGTVSRDPLLHAINARSDLADLAYSLEYQQTALKSLQVALTERQKYLAARPSTWPVSGIITSGFGYRRSPFGWGREFHHGLDISASHGTPITAPGAGTVTFSGYKAFYGYTVMINHDYGYVTLYAHCSRLTVSVGDEVTRGTVIAYVGSTGRSTGPHLHYEVRVDGRAIDPRPFLKPPDE